MIPNADGTSGELLYPLSFLVGELRGLPARQDAEYNIRHPLGISARLACDRSQNTKTTPNLPGPRSPEYETTASASGSDVSSPSKSLFGSSASERCPCRGRPRVLPLPGGLVALSRYGCKRCTRFWTKVTLRLPAWLKPVDLCFGLAGAPERILGLQRRVDWGLEENILKHCLQGNLDEAKHLLLGGRASLYDIDPNHGRTPLHVRRL